MSWHGKQFRAQHGGAQGNARVCDNQESTTVNDHVVRELHQVGHYVEYENVQIEMDGEDIIQDGESIKGSSSSNVRNATGSGNDGIAVSSSSLLCRFESHPSSKFAEEDILDAQKVDEWLKNRSDSLSSIEFENEIKQEEVDDEYEFGGGGSGEGSVSLAKTTQLSDFFARHGSHIEQNYHLKTSSPTKNQHKILVSGSGDGNEAAVTKRNQCRRSADTPSPQIPIIKDVFPIDAAQYEEGFSNVSESILNVLKVGNHSSNRILVDNCEDDNACDSDGPVFQDDLSGFCETTKDMMLMTPQELERMPESGLEFEESVGPREFEIFCKKEAENVESEAAATDVAAPSQSSQSAETTPAPLATISISTDKATNTTSIVINTKQGQQSFKINTANLMQAAATLQPVTIADLVEQNGQKLVETQPNDESGPSNDKDNSSEEGDDPETMMQQQTTSAEMQVSKNRAPTIACVQEEARLKGVSCGVCTHSGRCKKAWTCPEPQCGKMYAKQCKLKVHMMMHSKLRPYKCEVEGCDWAFTTIYKLKRHLETHCAMKDFVCDHEDCNRRFTTIYNLKSHKRLHTQPKTIKCPIDKCSLVFPTRRKMELHIKEHRDIEAPYKCPVESCNKAYYTTNSMASHLRSHQKSSFQCLFEGCGAEFDKMSRFKVHMWRHTGERPYACTFEGCNWAFSSASKLNRHTRKHTGERRYMCKEPGCGKSFMRLEHLQGHVVTHSGDKPYTCHHENCDARFTAKSSLYVHLKKHDGRAEKVVYPCPIESCDKKYNCKSSLRIHMLRYHETKLQTDYGHVEYITLLAKDDLQDATMTVDQFGQTVTSTSALSSYAIPEESKGADNATAINPVEVVTEQIDDLPITTSILPTTELLVPSMSSVVGTTILSNPASNMTISTFSPPPTTTSEVTILPSPSEMDTMVTSRLLQENNSGSARTDYCCNYMLMDRARKCRQQRRNEHQAKLDKISSTDCRKSRSSSSSATTSSDVVLTSTAITYRDPVTGVHFIQTPLLQDDPPSSHSDLYQEDGLLTSMASSLALPISLLAEQNASNPNSAQGPDFGSSSSTVAEFTGTTINLQDLE